MAVRTSLLALLLIGSAACSVDSVDNTAIENAADDPAARLIGQWSCQSNQLSDGQTLTVTSVERYDAAGTQSSDGVLKTSFQGIDITVNLRSRGEWSLDGTQLSTRSRAIDITDFKASGGYAAILPLDDLERALRQQMRASVAEGNTELSEITELTDNRLVISGTQNTIRTECTR